MKRLQNQDGSYNVYCSVCREFIATTFLPMATAKCALCDMAERGQLITEEAARTYMLAKAGKTDVSALTIPRVDPVLAKFNLKSFGAGFVRAVGFLKTIKPAAPVSEAVSVSKRRGRLFDKPDKQTTDSGHGNILDVDEELNKQ